MSEGDRRISRSSVGESVPSFHEKNSNDDNDSDVDDDMGTGNNNTMMSIFASYYGIEDDSKKNKLLIDSPQFDADEYIQVSKYCRMSSCPFISYFIFYLLKINHYL